ncbi:MAG: S1 RNA-binding domain-containing protein [Patescibacteria group bacterium]|nr:S1 RNA-binding domain-containing protein [Patescibacteria group bacterium]
MFKAGQFGLVSNTMVTKTQINPFADLLEKAGDNLKLYEAGDLVSGVVTAVTKNRIWIDIDDGRFVGIISNKELAEGGIAAPNLKAGDKVTASVLMTENDDGFMILSLKDALEQEGWDALYKRFEAEEAFDVKVVEANRGGLIVEADGLRGFLPVSQLAPENYPRVGNDKDEILSRLAKFEGEKMHVKILDLDKNSSKLIFSERSARKEEFEELVSDIKVGDVLEGRVSGVVDFGIFVSVGQLEGLVHISEISWDKVEHPSMYAKVGDSVKVQVIGIDDDKISLSMKRLTTDPWLDVIKHFKIGQTVKAKVTQIMPFGVFVKLTEKVDDVSEGVDGLIHISELAHEHVSSPENVVKEGEEMTLKVIDLGPESHRLGLSLKAMTKAPAPKVEEAGAMAAPSESGPTDDGLDALKISSGAINKLREAGLGIKDLKGKSQEELEALPGIGKVTAARIVEAMNK